MSDSFTRHRRPLVNYYPSAVTVRRSPVHVRPLLPIAHGDLSRGIKSILATQNIKPESNPGSTKSISADHNGGSKSNPDNRTRKVRRHLREVNAQSHHIHPVTGMEFVMLPQPGSMCHITDAGLVLCARHDGRLSRLCPVCAEGGYPLYEVWYEVVDE